MRLLYIAKDIANLGFTEKYIAPSKIIKSYRAFYQSCLEADSNLERELTPAEYHQLHACIWGNTPKSDSEIIRFSRLRRRELTRLGFSWLSRYDDFFEYLTRSGLVDAEAIAALAQYVDKHRHMQYIMRNLTANLWTADNINRLGSAGYNPHLHNIFSLLNDYISSQQTFELLQQQANTLGPLLDDINRHFLCGLKISVKDVVKLWENKGLFDNPLIWQALLRNKLTISLDCILKPTKAISSILHRATAFAHYLGFTAPTNAVLQHNSAEHKASVVPALKQSLTQEIRCAAFNPNSFFEASDISTPEGTESVELQVITSSGWSRA